MPLPLKRSRRAKPLLGTLVEITVHGPKALALDAAIDAAFAAMTEIHFRMSAHESSSDLAALLNAPIGAAVTVSPHTITVLRAGLQFAVQSLGSFNPCLGGPMARMGYLANHERTCSTDFTMLEIIDDQTLCRHAPVAVDVGGIAKGYAVDVAIATLQAAGVPSALVNAGGDLRCFGDCAETIGIRDPALPHQLAKTVCLQNAAMATSAPYFSQRGQYSALYDPVRQRAHTGEFSISVTAPECLTADALTKVALNASPALTAVLLGLYQAEAHWLGALHAA